MIRMRWLCLLFLLLALPFAQAQGTVPVFSMATPHGTYTLAGRDPAASGTTMIPTVLVPVTLVFETKMVDGKPFVMDASADARHIMSSPVFSKYAFAQGGDTQYADAMLHATFPGARSWHTLLSIPIIVPVTVTIPAGYGYVLTAKSSGKSIAVADSDYIEKQLFLKLPKQNGKLVVAVTHDTTFYGDGDATLCCTWGTHGIDPTSGTSFVLSTYLLGAPGVVKESDVQPLTQQLAEFFLDPLHNPSLYRRDQTKAGNVVAAWMRPHGAESCGGPGIGSSYFLLEPTDTNVKNNFPVSAPFTASANGATWHMQNVALLPWYIGAFAQSGHTYSFPDAQTLGSPATPCPDRRHRFEDDSAGAQQPSVAPVPRRGAPNDHALIGYWVGGRNAKSAFSLPDVSPQWDVVIVAFASPASGGALQFHPPAGTTPEQFKADVATLKSRGRKVLISLGGGGAYFRLDKAEDVPNFVSSVENIVSTYGFDGIDLDFESPSLALQPGDADFRHPTTPSVVHLIDSLQQLHARFGKSFMISLVPEGTQIPGGFPGYGGQFGSYLPITYAIRDMLSFVDVQDYNTPPLEGLDGEIYQVGSVDYDAAMTELLLHGFSVGGERGHFFPPLPANKVAVGFLAGFTTADHMQQAMRWIITGKAPASAIYKLRQPAGYPEMTGAMLWTIDADRRANYAISNTVGPQLHGYAAK